MRRVILPLLLVAIAWLGYGKHRGSVGPVRAAELAPAAGRMEAAPAPGFKCDGRIDCSQMTSCAEATFFLRHCPGVKMDGDGNGVPCERQWCGK